MRSSASEDPKAAVVSILLELSHEPAQDTALRQELSALRVMKLHARALADGVASPAVDDAMDSYDPKAELTSLILAQHADSEAAGKTEALETLRAELQGLRVMELHKRTTGAGVEAGRADDAMDSDDPKAELIALLLDAA